MNSNKVKPPVVTHAHSHPDSEYRMVSMERGDDRSVAIVKFYPSNKVLENGLPVPGVVEKEIYRAVAGRIDLVEVVVGKHVPRQVIEDCFEFPVPTGS